MQFTVSSRDLAEFAREARRQGRKGVTKEAGKELRGLVQPIVPELRQAYRALPSHTGKERSKKAVQERPRGLRDAMARGVQIKVSFSGKFAGVRLRIDPRHFPDGQLNMPKYIEGTLRWRSRNWGRNEWKSQQSHPVFFPTIEPHVPRVQAGIREVADRMSDQLRGS